MARKEPHARSHIRHRPGTRLRSLLALARVALVWERAWPLFWPVAGLAGLFVALALMDLLPSLPGWLHASILFALAAAVVMVVARGVRRLRAPTPDQIKRRLERDSGLAHRPLTTLDDRLSGNRGDAQTVVLWRLHRLRMRARLARLRIPRPRAGLAAADPYGLRAVVGLLLVIGLAVGGGDAASRLGRALAPNVGAFAAGPPVSLNVWVNPPAYTGQPPLFLDPARGEATPLSLPTGSAVLAQVQGGRGTPDLLIDEARTSFTGVAPDTYKVSARIETGARLSIEQGGRMLATWPLTIVPDTPPSIVFASPPGRSERAALKLEYQARDDHGLARVGATIRRLDRPDAAPIELDLALPGASPRVADGLGFHDLTPHPWAGLAVEIVLTADDALGQRGESEPARTVLPERIFNHPVARALVELRKRLTVAPEDRLPVVRALGEIYERPAHYFDDVVVALAVRSAERRLIHDRSDSAIGEVQQILWDTALHIEEGELAIAERDLRDIQNALMDALARGADDEEIERLIDELQRAVDRFLEALAEQLREQMARGEQPEAPPPNAQTLQGNDLRELIERARELAQTGARDAARDLLAQLQRMLENLRANPFAQALDDRSREAMGMMKDMEAITRRQRELLDRSFERAQEGRRDGEGRDDLRPRRRADARAQESLRRELGEMMRRLGEALGDIPRALGRAERATRDARGALQDDRPGDAVAPQTRAVDQLQQGMRAMAERFMEQLGQPNPSGIGQLGVQPGEAADPLGRRPGQTGIEALEGVEIPDRMELRRAKEILDELRRRRGEPLRPPIELDYIDRLLKQF